MALGTELIAPSVATFDEWLSPSNAESLITTFDERPNRQRWIMTRLRSGTIIAFARAAQFGCSAIDATSPVRVHCDRWRWIEPEDEQHFWETGDLEVIQKPAPGTFVVGDLHEFYFEIRFDPSSIPEPPSRPSDERALTSRGSSKSQRSLPPLSVADMRHFVEWLLNVWPSLTEKVAYQRTIAFFAEHHVSRDPFLVEFRAIRGPRKRGKQSRNTT